MTRAISGTLMLDSKVIEDPYLFYRQLRAEAPVWEVRVPGCSRSAHSSCEDLRARGTHFRQAHTDFDRRETVLHVDTTATPGCLFEFTPLSEPMSDQRDDHIHDGRALGGFCHPWHRRASLVNGSPQTTSTLADTRPRDSPDLEGGSSGRSRPTPAR